MNPKDSLIFMSNDFEIRINLVHLQPVNWKYQAFLVIFPVLIGIEHMSGAFRKGKTEKQNQR